jgi:hypothetical protein
MPLIVAKLITDDDVSDLDAAIDAYKAAGGAELLDTQRAMGADDFEEPDGDMRMAVLLCHGGLDIPATGTKTADLQHVNVVAQGDLDELQEAIDEALSLVVHATVTDADTTTPGTVTSATGPFEAEDVGRKISIGDEVRTITAFTSANSVDYDNSAAEGGDFASGSGLTLNLHGAEVLQDVRLEMQKRNASFRLHALLACEGEAY